MVFVDQAGRPYSFVGSVLTTEDLVQYPGTCTKGPHHQHKKNFGGKSWEIKNEDYDATKQIELGGW